MTGGEEDDDLMMGGVSPYWANMNHTGEGQQGGVVPQARPAPGIEIEGGGRNEG